LIFFFLAGGQNNVDQKAEQIISINDSTVSKVYNFPEDWKGHWVGELEIWSVDSVLQKVKMQLIIEGDSAITWNIIYGENGLVITQSRTSKKYLFPISVANFFAFSKSSGVPFA
jgi:hypothetical protein